MSVDFYYSLMSYLVSKNKQQGFFSGSDFNTVINQAQQSFFSYLLRNFSKYVPNHPQQNVELGNNQSVRQTLAPFIKEVDLIINSGAAAYPEDFEQVDAMYTSSFAMKPIRYVQQQYLPAYMTSVIDPINTNPVYLIKNDVIQFYPANNVLLPSAYLSYASTPPPIVWAYQLDANQRPVYTTGIQGVPIIKGGTGYSAATVTFSAPPSGGVQATGTVTIVGGVIKAIVMTNNGAGYNNTSPTVTLTGTGGTGALLGSPIVSVDPLWYATDFYEVISRALRMVGVSLDANGVSNYANQITTQGQ